eukprot:scaffold12471_cov55-Phaeocystis_antarctica.AAC.3
MRSSGRLPLAAAAGPGPASVCAKSCPAAAVAAAVGGAAADGPPAAAPAASMRPVSVTLTAYWPPPPVCAKSCFREARSETWLGLGSRLGLRLGLGPGLGLGSRVRLKPRARARRRPAAQSGTR